MNPWTSIRGTEDQVRRLRGESSTESGEILDDTARPEAAQSLACGREGHRPSAAPGWILEHPEDDARAL